MYEIADAILAYQKIKDLDIKNYIHTCMTPTVEIKIKKLFYCKSYCKFYSNFTFKFYRKNYVQILIEKIMFKFYIKILYKNSYSDCSKFNCQKYKLKKFKLKRRTVIKKKNRKSNPYH